MATVVPVGHLHLAGQTESVEDTGTLAYLADCAVAAGRTATILDIAEIGLSGDRFTDLDEQPIDRLFKLYPWEWLFAEDFGRSPAMATTRFIEPPWKAILANKGILPLLWEMAPGHPNLLPAFFDDDPRAERLAAAHVRKPLYSREGGNVELVEDGAPVERTGGLYGAEGYVLQAARPLPNFDGFYPVLGSWVVGNRPCGLGIREDFTRITTDRSRFLPHVIG
jgi:glutathionylspermidine synthase